MLNQSRSEDAVTDQLQAATISLQHAQQLAAYRKVLWQWLAEHRTLQYSMMLPSGFRQITLMRLRVLSNSRMFRIWYSHLHLRVPFRLPH